jgi:hypothetical protein
MTEHLSVRNIAYFENATFSLSNPSKVLKLNIKDCITFTNVPENMDINFTQFLKELVQKRTT